MKDIFLLPKNTWRVLITSISTIRITSELNLRKVIVEKLSLQREVDKMTEVEKNILAEELKNIREESIQALKSAVTMPLLFFVSATVMIMFVYLLMDIIDWFIGHLL